jgi:hypothetical protein
MPDQFARGQRGRGGFRGRTRRGAGRGAWRRVRSSTWRRSSRRPSWRRACCLRRWGEQSRSGWGGSGRRHAPGRRAGRGRCRARQGCTRRSERGGTGRDGSTTGHDQRGGDGKPPEGAPDMREPNGHLTTPWYDMRPPSTLASACGMAVRNEGPRPDGPILLQDHCRRQGQALGNGARQGIR